MKYLKDKNESDRWKGQNYTCYTCVPYREKFLDPFKEFLL